MSTTACTDTDPATVIDWRDPDPVTLLDVRSTTKVQTRHVTTLNDPALGPVGWQAAQRAARLDGKPVLAGVVGSGGAPRAAVFAGGVGIGAGLAAAARARTCIADRLLCSLANDHGASTQAQQLPHRLFTAQPAAQP